MRELTVRIRFTRPSLGNVKDAKTGSFLLPRDTSKSSVIFLPTWHKANFRFAAQLLGRLYDEVNQILWHLRVDGMPAEQWFRRYGGSGKRRYALHEAFFDGQEIGINCAVPSRIDDGDFWRLMQIAGQYKGLSPWKPGEWGSFDVVGLLPRRQQIEEGNPSDEVEAVRIETKEAESP